MGQQYDLSIVIPIYNCEKYIKKCVESIIKQDYADLNKVQVILVDDGSTDNSLEICKSLKREITSFTIDIITGKNGGVSAARNKGIRAALGKYIMFLDADDFISKNAIRKLIDFFDKHYNEIDILLCARYEYYPKTKEKKKIQRYTKCFDKTRVYDLEKEYQSIATTPNIMIKNLYGDNILFDTKMKLHEDTKYNIDILSKKRKLGYVDEVKYIYRKYEGQTTSVKNNPYYCFDDFINFLEYCVDKYVYEDGRPYKFIQSTVVHILNWRFSADKIYPYFYEQKEFENAINRINRVISRIDIDVFVNDKLMDRFHKIYWLEKRGIDFEIYTNHGGKFTINYGKNIVDVIDNIEIVFSRFKIKNKKIKILGYLKSPLLQFREPKLYIELTDNEKEIQKERISLFSSTANLYKSNIKVGNFYTFNYELDIKDVEEFRFYIEVENESVPIKYYFNTYASFNKRIYPYKVYDGEYRVQFKGNEFLVRKPNKSVRMKDLRLFMKKYNEIDKRINFFRLLAKITKKKKKKIWLYYDEKNKFDNGYIQFKHDIKIKDEIEKYYILDGNINEYKNKFSREERKNVVKFGSLKHKILYLNSDKILVSFVSMQYYCPLRTNFEYYKDILKYDLVYLQHGILHAKLLKMYSKIYTQIDKFVISSQFEENNLINNYDYKEEDLIKVGMPRLDEEIGDIEPENKIIFAPSWRKYLIGELENRKRAINKTKFVNSKYYKEIVDFLTNTEFIKILQDKNLVLDFKLHPIFAPYKDCFEKVINNNVTVSVGNTNIYKYKAFITDFSSFQFDFVNIQRPIIYFVPDMEEFKAGLHTYRELDLKYEDAFGNLCLNSEELLKEITKVINNNFSIEPLYRQRMEDFFFKVENRKDKLYEILKKS